MRPVTVALHGVRALALLVAVSAATASHAEHRITPEMVRLALEEQGFTVVSVTRTMLGRARFVASHEDTWREVVLDLSSGQILRDYAVAFSPPKPPVSEQGEMPRGGTLLPENTFPELTN